MLDINVYDMVVFEDAIGNIYQDCVGYIVENTGVVPNKLGNINMYNSILTNGFEVVINKTEEKVCKILYSEELDIAGPLKLKEVWTRVNEDTYKKKYVWSDEFKQLIPYRKGYITNNEVSGNE